MPHFKQIVGNGMIFLSLFTSGCSHEEHTQSVLTPPVSSFIEKKTDCEARIFSVEKPSPYQSGYLNKLDEWYEGYYWKKCPRKEPELMPEFEPDLNQKGEFFEGIYLDPNIPNSMYRALAKDIASIRHLTFADPDGKLQAILKTPDLKGETLQNWLRERIKYILDGPYGEKWRRNELSREEWTRMNEEQPLEDYSMENLSTNFIQALVNQVLPFERKKMSVYVIPGLKEPVKILSPHDGVIRTGTQLRLPVITDKPQTESRIRISILFHEARHADGNLSSKSLGFGHHQCGPDSPTRSEVDCDQAINGSYALQAYIARALALTCGDQCDQGKLLSESEHSLSRISRNATEWDDTPEGSIAG